MELQTSTVHRNLDARLKILGYELFDLLAILIFAAVMNLVFGRSSLSFMMVFILPGVLAFVIYYGKRGKPDNFLVHCVRYYLLPGALASGDRCRNEEKMTRSIYFE